MKYIWLSMSMMVFTACASKGNIFLTGEFEPLTGTPMTEGIYQADTIHIDKTENRLVIHNGSVRIDYNLAAGTANVYREGQEEPFITGMFAETDFKGNRITSASLQRSADSVFFEEIEDSFGKGVKVSVKNTGDGFNIWQNFFAYRNKTYILLGIIAEAAQGVTTNYIAPIAAESDGTDPVVSLGNEAGDPRFLFVPYDNDAHIRYRSDRFIGATESYEVTAIFDNDSRKGMVLGSVTHDTWKTGIRVRSGFSRGEESAPLINLRVFGGIATGTTRDTQPHGSVTGYQVHSPLLFLGFFDDWREGLDEYGHANTLTAPPLRWDHGVPFGWNSWYAVGSRVTLDLFTEASDFIKNELPHFSNGESGVYINFDSFWDRITVQERRDAAAHARANGQRPGIYHTPFTAWHGNADALFTTSPDGVPEYRWFDLVLKDQRGRPLRHTTDMGFALDPTHPGTIAWNYHRIGNFIEWGYEFIKLDFLSHGSVEGRYHNRYITTGKQAYNYGMQKILEFIGDRIEDQEFFLSLSIGPLFPHQYFHSRRVSCDVNGPNYEYMLNSLSYGWWQHGTLYPFNDPDHMIIYGSFNRQEPISFNQGLSRYISTAISGTKIFSSDDFRVPEVRERARQIYNNENVNKMAAQGISFRPVEGNTDNRAADIFVRIDAENNAAYLAVFNFTQNPRTVTVNLERAGIDPRQTWQVFNMITGQNEAPVSAGSLSVTMEASEPMLFRLHR